MTDNTQADEYLQEQLVEQGDVSSMRYIGDDYTRIVTIREDRLLNIITAYTNKQIEEVIKKPHILPKNAQHQESVKQGINFYHRQMRKRVDKLKEVK